MGLSEREQQLLDEMERRLYQSEADVLQTSAAPTRLNLRSLVLGIVIVLAGLGAVIAGVAMQQFWLGLVGFAVMLGGALFGFSKGEGEETIELGADRARPQSQAARESFADRMERRWDQRLDGER
jgi:hypothetical protein